MNYRDSHTYIFEDIDQVLYPFKKQFIEFVRFKNNYKDELLELLIKEYENEDVSYFNSFLTNKIYKSNNSEMKEEYFKSIKSILKNPKNKTNTIVDIHYELLREMGNSKYFLEGTQTDMKELNEELHKYNIIKIGITARGTMQAPNYIYDDCLQKTKTWNIKEDVKLNHIFLQDFEDKHHTISQMKEIYPTFKKEQVICMIEDNTQGLKTMLAEGIPGILINLDKKRNKEDINTFQKYYNNIFYQVSTYTDAKLKALELTKNKLQELRKH